MNKLVNALDQVFESDQIDPKAERVKSLMESVQRHRLRSRIIEKQLKESFADRDIRDDVVAAVEDGFLSWETVGMAALKYMSADDVKDMIHYNDWKIADDEDFEDFDSDEEGEE